MITSFDRFDVIYGCTINPEYLINLSEGRNMKVEIILQDDEDTNVLKISNCEEEDYVNISHVIDVDGPIKVKLEDLKLALRKISAK